MLTGRQVVICIIASLVGGFILGEWTAPTKVETKEVIKTVEVQAKAKDVKVITVTKPDGTVIKSREVKTEVVKVDAIAQTKSEIKYSSRPNYAIDLGYGLDRRLFIGASTRVAGPLSVGVYILNQPSLTTSELTAGAFVRLEF